MKKILNALLLVLLMQFAGAQYVTIPDAAFVTWLNSYGFSSCMSGNRMDTTCAKIMDTTSLTINYSAAAVQDLTGIQYFKSLTTLNITSCPLLHNIPTLPNTIQSLTIAADSSLTTIAAFPTALTYTLIQSNAMLTSLPAWPNNLRSVTLQNSQITVLPLWPDSLISLSLINVSATQLPPLPPALIALWVDNVPIMSIQAFPSSLYYIYFVNDSTLTALPALPVGLHNLTVSYTSITTMPTLPPYIDTLNCINDKLTSLPTSMPNSMMIFACSGNQLTSLPPLSNRLILLACNNNPGLTCLPFLPATLQDIEFYNTGVTCVPNYLPVTGMRSETPVLSSLPLCQPGNANGCYAAAITAGANQNICLNSTATMTATDTGTWVALVSNPAPTTIADSTWPNTTITGFTVAGTYGYQWGTLTGDTVYVYVAGRVYPRIDTVITNPTSLCSGAVQTFTAIPFNNDAGSSPSFHWNVNGTWLASDSNVLVITLQHTASVKYDSIVVVVISDLACSIGDSASYGFWLPVNSIPVTPSLALAGTCLGADTLVLSGADAPEQINWYKGNTLVAIDSFPPLTVAGGNGMGTAANQLYYPYDIFVDASDNLYVLDSHNTRVQKFPAGSNSLTNGITIAGGNGGGSAANQFNSPNGIYVDASGNLYVADEGNQRIQMFPAGSTSATNATTIAGGNGSGSAANQFDFPTGVYGDAAGNIYVTDEGNYRVQKFPSGSNSSTNGVTVAGGNGIGYGLNQFEGPQQVFVDINGNIYVNDIYRGVIKFPSGSTSATYGTIIATRGLNPDQSGTGVFVASSGTVYTTGGNNESILQYAVGSNPNHGITVAGGNGQGSSEYQFDGPNAVFLDTAGDIYVADLYNNRIQKWHGNGAHSPSYVPNTPGNYAATYTTIGCSSVISNAVTVTNCNPTSDTVTICRGSADTLQAYLNPGQYSTYIWTPGTGLSDPHSLNPVASPTVSTTYILSTVDTDNGGLIHDTILVMVDTLCNGFVWPGDADNNGIVDNNDLLPIGLTYNFNGPARAQQDMLWYAHYAIPWAGTNAGGINDVYSDCNGDGTVDITDVNAILNNYSFTHAKAGDLSQNRSGNPPLKMVIMPDTLLNGDTLICHIILGDSLTPANNVYGLAFTFDFNPLVADTASVKMTFPDSWLAMQSEHITLAKNNADEGAVYAGLSRIDRTARSGSGEIATVSMVITTDNIDGKNLSYYTDQLGISFVKVINQLGDTIPVNRLNDSAIIGFQPTGIINNEQEALSVKLYPDPANNMAQILSTGGKMTNLVLNDVLDRQVAIYDQINTSIGLTR